jgi:RNA polymerase sigma-70 factor (ECF subfamily)
MSPQGLKNPPEADIGFSTLWELHAPGVKRHLARFGVYTADLDDLAQEVFLLAHEKRKLLATVEQVDPWLREVCRRVAAAHRRRAHRRHEIAFGEPPEPLGETAALESALERGQEEDRLHQALEQLDEKSRDLVALHQLGDLPLVEVATLVEADRKTVRKRLSAALRRLTLLLGSNDGVQGVATSTSDTAPPSGRVARPPVSAPFQPLAKDGAVRVGMVGAVVIAVWPGPPTIESLELLDAQFRKALETCTSGFAYLAVVEASTRPPTYEARQKIVAMIKAHAANIRVYATALEGGAAWIAKPIMTALSLLARPPFPMLFFNGTESAASFLAETQSTPYRANASALLEAIARLRAD